MASAAAAAAAVSFQLSIFGKTSRDPDCLRPCPHVQGALTEQTARATPASPPPICPELPGNTHSCTVSIQHTDKHVQYQQQQTVACLPAWLAGWLLTKPRLSLPGPRRQEQSGGDNLWPPATSSQLYICHTLITSSPRPPTEQIEE